MSSHLIPGPAGAEPEKIGHDQAHADNHDAGATAPAKTRHDWLGRAPIIETSVIGGASHVPKRFAEHDYGGSAVGEGRAPAAREG